MDQNGVPAGVGWTSLLTAYARAQETERPDRLFDDPWAGPLINAAVGGNGGPLPRVGPARPDGGSALWSMFATFFACRTPFFDQHVRTAVADGARQIVILAAGLDARAARLDLPDGIPVFEVDSAQVLDFKAAVLRGAGSDVDRRIPVVADLAQDWLPALRAAGFRSDVRTAWLVEGLLMYLDAAAGERLVTTACRAGTAGGRIAVEYFRRNPREDDVDAADEEERKAVTLTFSSFASGPQEDPGPWLTRLGVAPDRVSDIAREIRSLGRDVPPELDPARPDPVHCWLADGTF